VVTPPVFVCDPAQIDSDLITLAGSEGRHASTVRRVGLGERVDLTDAAGHLAECRVVGARPGELDLAVLTRRYEPEPACRVTVVQAIMKGDRSELAVTLMTEVGVDVIVAWAAERCVARWRSGQQDHALARWRSAAREAGKQSRRWRFPDVTGPAATTDVAALVRAASLALLLDLEAAARLRAVSVPRHGDVVLIVGPEGGVAPGETAELIAAGAVPTRLGPAVLRGSTAGAVAAALVLSGCGRWG
jgi:16S rRNA (uracil1498-N3)-methyltransferase